MRNAFLCTVIALLITARFGMAQSIVSVSDTMPNLTLRTIEGKSIALKDLRGKNVMLVFPRGKVGDHWCQICHYQYAELAEIEKNEQIQKKYDLQVVYILPYDMESVTKWVNMLPNQLKVIEKWKNPDNPEKLSAGEKSWMQKSKELFPKKFSIDSLYIPKPFIVAADEDRKISMGLGIFTTFWDYSYVEQNISSIFLIDKKGVLQFKYVSQNTMDRPKPEYLLNFIKKMMNE